MISPHDKGAIENGWWVDRDVYTSDEILQREKEKIFYKTWHFACLAHELENKGDYFAMSIVDQPILITRGNDDKLHAFFNACTHRGAVLNNHRCGNERLFKCMYHAWAFNLQGELVGVPYEEGYGPDFDKKKLGLVPVRVETFQSLVFVTINPEAPPLREYLGEIAPFIEESMTDIEMIGRVSWTFEANWKFWHENFRDNYHPQFTHRMINDMTPNYAENGGNFALAPGHSSLRFMTDSFSPNIENLVRGLERYSDVSFPRPKPGDGPAIDKYNPGGDAPYFEVLAVFPNFDIQPGHFVPGAGYLQTLTPLSTGKTRVDILFYGSKHDTAQARQYLLENQADSQGSWGKVSADDTEAAMRCHIGVKGIGTRFSPFARGVAPGKGGMAGDGAGVDGRDEFSLREFYRVYRQYMDAPTAPLAVAAE